MRKDGRLLTIHSCTRFTFHIILAAHENNAKSRIKDAKLIVNNMNLPNKSKIGSPTYGTLVSDVTTRFDCVFWCGDMNWR